MRRISFSLPSLVVVLLAACAKNESAVAPVETAPFVVPARGSPPVAVFEPESLPDAAATAVAEAVDAAPPVLDARCIGANLDLTFLLLGGWCRGGARGAPAKAAALRMIPVPQKPLAPGGSGSTLITLMNTSGADLDVTLDLPEVAGLGPAGGVVHSTEGPTLKVRQSTTTADGKRSFDATWVTLGLLPPVARFRISAGGVARLRVMVRARGFLPGKDYDPSSHALDEPPDPLPAGRYRVKLHVPVSTEGDAPVIELEVR